MKPGTRSLTADFAAMMRAAHVILDDDPKILKDNYALKLCGFEDATAFRQAMVEIERDLASKLPNISVVKLLEGARSGIAVRSKMAEQRLFEAIERGASQYVILGAGLDSSAYRLPGIADKLRIFEVDFPATQQWKRARLKEIEPHLLDTVTFVSVDFESESLFERLASSGYDLTKPTFFSWLGVVWYLSDDAIFTTLSSIGALESACEVVFEYPVATELVYPEDHPLMGLLKQAGAARGEPMREGFNPDDLIRRVEELGFDTIEDFPPARIHEIHFQNRSDNLRMPGIGHFISARRSFSQ